LEYLAQPLDNIIIVNFFASHPRRVVVAPILVPEGVAGHQWLHPLLHEVEGHMLSPQSSLSKGLDLLH
jgi:hypothetical protein